jgi:hypothetical protein
VSLASDDGEEWPGWYIPSFSTGIYAGLRMPQVTVSGYGYDPDDQPVLTEVWIEKSTMDDVLVPACRDLNVNLLSGAGFQSITASISLLRRAERHAKPAHVLYIADFDPAGDAMPRAVARQVQFWRESLAITTGLTLDVLALTRRQVAEYDLPRAPVKVDKNGVADKRGKRFEQVNGEGIVELDALEALHPGVLAELVRHAVQPYRDERLEPGLDDADHSEQRQADDHWRASAADIATEMHRLDEEIAGILRRHRPALDELNRELRERRERLDVLADRARERFAGTEFELPFRPAAAEPGVDTSLMLYNSRRPWTDQLAAYRNAKAGSDETGAA